MTIRRTIRSVATTAMLAAGLGLGVAAPAHADATEATAFTASCTQGTVEGTWTRSGSAFSLTIQRYNLYASASDNGTKNGAVYVTLNSGKPVGETGLVTDRNWHDSAITATTSSSAPVEANFSIRSGGFPAYPTCSVTKWY